MPGAIFKPELEAPPDDAVRFKSWPPSEAELLEWEARPTSNESLRWSFVVNAGTPRLVGPDARRQHVGLLRGMRNGQTGCA